MSATKPRTLALRIAIGAAAAVTAATAAAHATAHNPASSASQATARLKAAGIHWTSSGGCSDKYTNGCTSFQGIRSATLEGVIALRRASNCPITITGAAEVHPHSTKGSYTHGNGYKVDVRFNPCIDHYITSHSTRIKRRSDGAARWASGTTIYAKESSHWDVLYMGTGRSTQTTTPAGHWPVLRNGSHGTQVTTLQHLLRTTGARITADGRYGPATTTAVEAFQHAHGLTADGVTGPNTWQHVTPTLRPGARGEAVQALQQELARRGARITVDGRYGPATTTAVEAFQHAHGLTADGVTGPNTWRRLLTNP